MKTRLHFWLMAVALVPSMTMAATLPSASTGDARASQAVLAAQARLEVPDPNDTRSPLDVREVDVTASDRDLTFSAATYSTWRTRDVTDRGFVVIHLDPRNGSRYFAVVRATRKDLVAILFRKQPGRDARVSGLQAWRPDRGSVSVRISRRRLGLLAPGAPFAWRLQTVVTSARCPRVCVDSAPDRGDAAQTARLLGGL